jgi:hypothetical protein
MPRVAWAGVEVAVGLGADQGRGQHALDELLQPAASRTPTRRFPARCRTSRCRRNTPRRAVPGGPAPPGRRRPRRRARRAGGSAAARRSGTGRCGGRPPRWCRSRRARGLLAGAEEMVVVHRHVFHAAVGQRRHHRDVDPLGEPGAARPLAPKRARSLAVRRRSGRGGRAAGSPPAPARSRRRRTARPGRARPSP